MIMSHASSEATADLTLPSLTHILIATSKVMDMPISEIVAPGRWGLNAEGKSTRLQARQIAAYVARNTSKRPWNMIARRLNRNHATVMHAVETASALVRRNNAEMIAGIANVTRIAWELHEKQRAMVGAA